MSSEQIDEHMLTITISSLVHTGVYKIVKLTCCALLHSLGTMLQCMQLRVLILSLKIKESCVTDMNFFEV